jgi:hypothetical protein
MASEGILPRQNNPPFKHLNYKTATRGVWILACIFELYVLIEISLNEIISERKKYFGLYWKTTFFLKDYTCGSIHQLKYRKLTKSLNGN